MKVTTKVCEKCRNEDCDGVIYRIPKGHPIVEDEYYRNLRLCKNNSYIIKKQMNEPNVKMQVYLWMGSHFVATDDILLEEVPCG